MSDTGWEIARLVPWTLGRKAMHLDTVSAADDGARRAALYSAGKMADEVERMLRAVFFPVPPPRAKAAKSTAIGYRMRGAP